MRRIAVLGVVLCSATAGAQPVTPERVVVIGRASDRAAWTDAATEARLDQDPQLAAIVIGKRGKQRVVLGPAGIAKAKLAGKTVRVEPWAHDVTLQWSIVEPHGFRTQPAANGATSSFYSNVSTEAKGFGTWLGYDRIEYFERVVHAWGARPIVAAEVSISEQHAPQPSGLGTVFYKVEIDLASARLASPGAEATDTYGLTRAVHRVSIRKDDDFLGWLSAYLFVPEVFGSAGGGGNHQTERFTGADCADVLVGALRRSGKRVAYTNVAGLPAHAKMIVRATVLDERGMPPATISGVRVGDVIRIDYGGSLANHTPRAFDHVAALWEDRSDPAGPHRGGPDGQLDGFDLVIHMGHPRLVIEPLSGQSPATIDVLRWNQK